MNWKFVFIILIFHFTSCHVELSEDEWLQKTVFRYNEPGGVLWLDPAMMSKYEDFLIAQQIFNGLVMLDEDLNVQPCIAHSWNISTDGLVYTFHLRKDVQFHTSSLLDSASIYVDAYDVVYSFNRIIDPATASPGKYIFQNLSSSANALKALNDSTIQVNLQKPQPSFLYQLCLPYGSILPSELIEHYGTDFSQHVIGTGPFKLKSWKKDIKLILIKNDHYFELDNDKTRLPYLDAVSVSFLADRHQEFIKFKTGKLEMISGLNEDDKDILLTPEGVLREELEDQFYIEKRSWLNTDYIGILVNDSINQIRKNPLRHLNVRKAIACAIDRKKLVKYLRNGVGIPANEGFIPRGMPGYDQFKIDGYHYDVNSSLRLLDEIDVNEPIEVTLSATEPYRTLCEFLQNQIENIGIKVKVDIHTSSSLTQRISQFDALFYRKSWVADYPEAINYFQLFYSPNFFPENGYNYTHFKNDQYDIIYEKAIVEQDLDKRYKLYKELQQIIKDQVPVIPLFYAETLRFYAHSVKGIKGNSMNMLQLKKVKIMKQ